ncbi:MAG: rhodanese-like domain-containing protein [Erythrobacter sp.]|nr:rhodanese-like domain-containing protein [Erythrobacter sp.]
MPSLALAALALSACAPEDGKKDKESAPLPLGFEIASAKAATGSAHEAVIDLNVDQLKSMLAKGNVRLIDVRTPEEVAEGMIPNAEHIAMDDFDPSAIDLSDGREVVLYCRSGRRSRIVGEKLAVRTGQPARHLSGGIIAWNDAERGE